MLTVNRLRRHTVNFLSQWDKLCLISATRFVHIVPPLHRFHEYHPKGEYADRTADPKFEKEAWEKQESNLFGLKDGFKDLRTEIVKWANEWKEHITDDTRCYIYHGDRNYVWDFKSPDILNKWHAVSDADMLEGYSRSEITTSPTGKALFHGFVNTRTPEDGKIKRAGYCATRCERITKSFYRESYLDWSSFSHLILRVRGDGRNYIINISTAGYFDITWNDCYHYVLYTRGGPYWQDVKIPFSKFVYGSKGRVQDKQCRISLDKIAALGIAVGQVDGPFSLEIDYIGVECDDTHYEETAYEMYRIPTFVADV